MYRGSGFLLQPAYTAHLEAVDVLAAISPVLWTGRIGEQQADVAHVSMILDAVAAKSLQAIWEGIRHGE